jgi:hypothetical protein
MEQRVESRERVRIDTMNKELASRKSHADWEHRHRVKIADELQHWDDDDRLEKGRELFFADRYVTQPRSRLMVDVAGEHKDVKYDNASTKTTSEIVITRKRSSRHSKRNPRHS